MTTISVLVVPEVVRNKPETERNHVVTGMAKGWQKTSLNQDPDEILTECKGLDALLTKSNLQSNGTTKIDPTKPIGFNVEYQIYDPNAINVTGIDIIPLTASGVVGGQLTFDYDITPANATYPQVKWSSADETVAKSLGGGVFSLLKAGTVKVRVTAIDGGVYAESNVTVTAPVVAVTGVTLAPTTAAIKTGLTQQLTATVAPANATNKAVTYASSNTAVATVNASGLVTAVGNGTATITVTTTDGAKTATCAVTVTTAVTGVTVSPTTASLAVAGTQQLTPTVAPATASVKTVTYSTSNAAVATVNSSGLITAVAVGTATITVTTTDGAKTATCAVTVA